ncbi:hypothetical protein AAG747_17825 [Rapidithrix thailandica]|uniref:Uncharacterized protein n=1 Tax=Rapidithrix thailandica TaxID=413964 RepID=A0AAW9S7E1_9BACT
MYSLYKTDYPAYRYIILAFYGWMLLEGILRKWVAPSLATPLFFVKYMIIYLGLFLFLIRKERLSIKSYPFIGFVLFFIFYCVLQLFNFKVTSSPFLGVIGFVIHTGFITLVFLLPKVITERTQVDRLLDKIQWLVIPIFLLGVIQYFSPASSFLNTYSDKDSVAGVAMVGGHVRVTTIFSYIAGHTSFLNFVMLLLFFKVLQIEKLTWKNILLLFTVLLGVLNAFMSGSRGVVFITFGQYALIFFIYSITLNRQQFVSYTFKSIVAMIVLAVGMQFTEQGKTAINSFMERFEKNNDLSGRIADSFDPFKYVDYAGVVGMQIGSTYQGASQFLDERWRMPPYWEEESERLVIELGVLGFLVIMIMRLAIFFYGIRTVIHMDDKWSKLFAIILTVHQVPTVIIINQVTFNWVENITYWTSVGLLVFINNFHNRSQQHEASTKKYTSLASG